jgi:1-acyl-sn-glycerol-3-phosphate acyltransferase
MSATGTQLERSATAEEAIATIRQLLVELGASGGIEQLAARGRAAHLERELGLGSLERVELMVRLGDACGVRLADRVVAEAETVQDLIDALVFERTREKIAPGMAEDDSWSRSTAIPAGFGPRPELEQQIRTAESLTEILRLRGAGEPERAHLHIYQEDEKVRVITFGELYARASAVASELCERGLEVGQTVAVMLPTCADFFYAFAGILLAGGIPVPLYPPFRADRIAEYATRQANILRNAEARFLITFRQAQGLARLLQPRVPSLLEILNAERLANVPVRGEPTGAGWQPVKNLAHRAHGEDIAFLQYTSGSTGDPKGVTLTHANLLANIRSIIAGLEVHSQDVVVSWLPLYHDMGLIGAWLAPLYFGVPVVAMSPLAFLSRPQRWLRAIHEHRGTLSPAPNFAYELCVRKIQDEELEGLDLSSWRGALNGAELVQASTLERFAGRFARCGFRREAFLPVYGLAEASLAVSAPRVGSGYTVDRVERDALESEGHAVPARNGGATVEFVSAGKALPDVEVRIVNSDGRDVGERTVGQLWFKGPSATSGYYRNEEATRTLIREDGWLDSGDRAYCADGEIYITGRAKDVIIKAGRNLYPHEIEEIVGRVQGVRAGCVVAFGVRGETSGTEKLIVAAEARNPSEAKQIAAVIVREVDQAIGAPPDSVEVLTPHSIPKTSSGKLRRVETRRLFLEGKLGKKAAPTWAQLGRLALRSTGPRAWISLKRGCRRIGEVPYGIYVLAAFGIGITGLWLAIALTRNRIRAARMLKGAARLMLRLAAIPVRIEGNEAFSEAVQSGACIFAPNHSSYVDILAMLALLPTGVRFVAKGEALKMPLVGTIMRKTGAFAFDRNSPAERMGLAREVDAALLRGESVAIYPEGTFTSAVGIRPFHLGAFKAAALTHRPICPVAIRGARRILRDGTFLPRPGDIAVTFGPLVKPDQTIGTNWREIVRLRDATREIMARNSGEPLL